MCRFLQAFFYISNISCVKCELQNICIFSDVKLAKSAEKAKTVLKTKSRVRERVSFNRNERALYVIRNVHGNMSLL